MMAGFTWHRGPYTWIAHLRGHERPLSKLFKLIEPPAVPAISELCNRLIKIGGTSVCIYFVDEGVCAWFLETGQEIPFKLLEFVPGLQSDCHANVARLWSEREKNCRIVTGYGLSDDGMWRQHSCLLDGDKIIETTEPRIKYFGVILNQEMAQPFYDAHFPI